MLASGMRMRHRAVQRFEPSAADGLVIAVYGTDGSGKSLLIAGLRERLSGAFTSVLHVHLFAVQDPERPAPPMLEPHGRPPRSLGTSVVKSGWYLTRAWLDRAPRLRRARRRGYLVLLDRDLHDAAVDPLRYRFSSSLPLLPLLERWAPRPDLGLLLDAPPDVLVTRTSEISLERATALSAAYREFATRSPWVRTLDAGRPAHEVLDTAVATILQASERPARASSPAADGAAPIEGGTVP